MKIHMSALLHMATINKSYTWTKKWKWLLIKVKHPYILNVARCLYVRSYDRNAGRGQLSSKRRHYDNDVTMIIAGLIADGTSRRYGEWQHAAACCSALVICTSCAQSRIKHSTSVPYLKPLFCFQGHRQCREDHLALEPHPSNLSINRHNDLLTSFTWERRLTKLIRGCALCTNQHQQQLHNIVSLTMCVVVGSDRQIPIAIGI